jgi:hypothetical protein
MICSSKAECRTAAAIVTEEPKARLLTIIISLTKYALQHNNFSDKIMEELQKLRRIIRTIDINTRGESNMTSEEREMFNRIRNYAEKALEDFDTDPQKTPISFQLQKLRPIMQELAMEKQMAVEDIFIKYMDLASEDAVEREKQFQERLDEDNSFSGRANRA